MSCLGADRIIPITPCTSLPSALEINTASALSSSSKLYRIANLGSPLILVRDLYLKYNLRKFAVHDL